MVDKLITWWRGRFSNMDRAYDTVHTMGIIGMVIAVILYAIGFGGYILR